MDHSLGSEPKRRAAKLIRTEPVQVNDTMYDMLPTIVESVSEQTGFHSDVRSTSIPARTHYRLHWTKEAGLTANLAFLVADSGAATDRITLGGGVAAE
eukprot:jgi/Tetstr1/424889/TSEL_015384.t1